MSSETRPAKFMVDKGLLETDDRWFSEKPLDVSSRECRSEGKATANSKTPESPLED